MRLEAMKRQGKRTDLTLSPEATKLAVDSAKELGEQVGESRDQIFRYIRLNELVPEILNLVDEGKIAMRPAVEISYLPEESQHQLFDAVGANDCTPSHDQTIRMRKAFNEGKLTQDLVEDIMCEEKPNQKEKPPIRDSRIIQLIPNFSFISSLDIFNSSCLSNIFSQSINRCKMFFIVCTFCRKFHTKMFF